MGNFLTRLLERTSACAPVLQARTPALFEPVRGAPAASLYADMTARLATPEIPVERRGPSAPSAPSAPSVPIPDAPARPRPPMSRGSEPGLAIAPAPVTAAASRRDAALRPAATTPSESSGEQLSSPHRWRASAAKTATPTSATGEAPVTGDPPATAAREPASAAPVLGRSIVSPAHATAPPSAATQAPGHTAGVAPNRASPAAIAARASRQAPPQQRSRPPIRPRPAGGQNAAAGPVGAMRSAPSVQRGVQPPPPTVHVTIGRLEVRATRESPGARPPAPRRAAPTLDLEQYLRSRGGGGR